MPPPGPGGKIIMELVTKQQEMAAREEIIMVREFQRDLAYNMEKVRLRAPWQHLHGEQRAAPR